MSRTTPPQPSPALWRALVLLSISVGINYIDRGNLSVAAPLLKTELRISETQIGMLLSAFFWTYAAFQLVSGWLADRFDANWVLAGGFFLWSAATAATGLIGGFASLIVFRLLVGMGESVAYPTYSKIFSLHYGEEYRGWANSLIDVGCKLGPALGTLFGGYFVAKAGWRPLFFVLGLGAFLWLPFWFRWMPRGPGPAAAEAAEKPPIGEILRHRSAWGTFAGLFCGNYYWYFLLTWLPLYLVQERHFSMERMAVFGSLPFFVTAASTTVFGWASYRALLRGAKLNTVRKSCAACGLGMSGLVIIVVPVISSAPLAMGCLLVASFFYGIYTTSLWAITQTLAGPAAAGRWTGLQNFCGNLAGVVAPWLTGLVVATTGKFFWAFAVTAIVAVVGALVYLFGIGRVEAAVWKRA